MERQRGNERKREARRGNWKGERKNSSRKPAPVSLIFSFWVSYSSSGSLFVSWLVYFRAKSFWVVSGWEEAPKIVLSLWHARLARGLARGERPKILQFSHALITQCSPLWSQCSQSQVTFKPGFHLKFRYQIQGPWCTYWVAIFHFLISHTCDLPSF